MSKSVKIGIIGGTGLDNPDLLEDRQEKDVTTPFGKPSDHLIFGKIAGIDCVLLARHGRRHHVNPTKTNYCANIWALKEAGCTCLIVTSACGSLKEDIHPGQVVILDQFIDWTKHRRLSYYDCSDDTPCKGVCHIPMANPFCSELREDMINLFKQLLLPKSMILRIYIKLLIDVARQQVSKCHEKGTIVVVEGPRFSTKAESYMFRSFDASVIGMTTVPEVTLANELALPYATIALVTDYDCWHDNDELHVSVENVMASLEKSATMAKSIIMKAIPRIAKLDWTTIGQKHEAVVQRSVML